MRRTSQYRRYVSACAAGFVAVSGASFAFASSENISPDDKLPPEAQGIEIVEKVATNVPLDVTFVDESGKAVTPRDYVDGNLPLILTFNYSNCPGLCSAQLNALVEGMKGVPFVAGEQYQILTIGLDPHETPDTARSTKEQYIALFPEHKRDSMRAGWHFLTGDKQAIDTLADAVGMRYRHLPKTNDYVHPATLVFLSPAGAITRYYHGIYYEPTAFGTSIFKAGAGEYGVSVGFLLACYKLRHLTGYANMGEQIMRYGAIGFVIFMLAAFGVWQAMRKRARQEIASQE